MDLLGNIGLTDLDAVLNSLDTISVPNIEGTLYFICEKKSFRSDAFVNHIKDLYKVRTIYTSSVTDAVFEDVLCIVIDISQLLGSRAAKTIIEKAQETILEQNKQLFIIGEKTELDGIKKILKNDDTNATWIRKEIEIREVINIIENKLLAESITEEKPEIWVCDDSITYLKLVRKTLEGSFKVVTAKSTYEFIQLLAKSENKPPALFLLDYLMPICDGTILCRMLKDQPYFKNVPVVFLSSNSNVHQIIDLMPWIDGYILKSKPTDLEEYIKETIKKKEKEVKGK